MNIDPVQILQMTLYSKIMQDISTQSLFDYKNITLFIVAYFTYTIYQNVHMDHIYDWLNKSQNQSLVVISSHTKKYMCGYPLKETNRTIFSTKFQALIHYFLETQSSKISSLKETIKMKFDGYCETDIEFMLLPHKNTKILVEKDPVHGLDIFIEFSVKSIEFEDESRDDKSRSEKKNDSVYNQYSFSISVIGANNIPIINDFLDRCEEKFLNKSKSGDERMIYELEKIHTDDDDNKKLIVYQYPFKSNKRFENIFYDNKQDLIDFINPFIVSKKEKTEKELEYERLGITFKAAILLYGEPGCGKSSTIRAILNTTGRCGVLIRWNMLKSCSDFCNVFRKTDYNGIKYHPKELCYIFEDFDANSSKTLKSRRLEKDQIQTIMQLDNELKKTSECSVSTSLETIVRSLDKTNTDDLTLECVLNVLDGIKELHDVMIVFTTNHLDDIDPAFIRPGRIDFKMELKKMSVSSIKDMIQYKYCLSKDDLDKYSTHFSSLRDGVLSPADVQNICFRFPIDECFKHLTEQCNV